MRILLATGVFALVIGTLSPAHAKDAAGPERFLVTGVIFVEGGGGMAWIQEPTFTQNQVMTLRPGDMVGPYKLSKVLEDGVELEGPKGTIRIPLYGGPSKGGDSGVASRTPASTSAGKDGNAAAAEAPAAPAPPQTPAERLTEAKQVVQEARQAARRADFERRRQAAEARAANPPPPIPKGTTPIENIRKYIRTDDER
jgi:hypothetical protein